MVSLGVMDVTAVADGADALPLSGVRVWLTDALIDRAAGPPGLGIQHCDAPDGSVTVRVVGDLDIASSGQLRTDLDRLSSTTRLTILDLSATSFIDCSGLGVVLHAARTARTRRWSFSLAPEHSPAVAQLIAFAGAGPSLIDDRSA